MKLRFHPVSRSRERSVAPTWRSPGSPRRPAPSGGPTRRPPPPPPPRGGPTPAAPSAEPGGAHRRWTRTLRWTAWSGTAPPALREGGREGGKQTPGSAGSRRPPRRPTRVCPAARPEVKSGRGWPWWRLPTAAAAPLPRLTYPTCRLRYRPARPASPRPYRRQATPRPAASISL